MFTHKILNMLLANVKKLAAVPAFIADLIVINAMSHLLPDLLPVF